MSIQRDIAYRFTKPAKSSLFRSLSPSHWAIRKGYNRLEIKIYEDITN